MNEKSVFEQQIEQIQQSSCCSAALKALEVYAKSEGFDYYTFSKTDIQQYPANFHIDKFETTYPQKWQERYMSQNYGFIDPIYHHLLSHEGPFYWSEFLASENPAASQDVLIMMADAQKYGIFDGIGLSYMRGDGFLYGITVACSCSIKNYDRDLLSRFYFLGSLVVNLFCHDKNLQKNNSIKLTSRERDILSLAVVGKSDSEIAQLIGISSNTVRYHWKNIFQKLDSYGRIFAVTRAVSLNLINPDQFSITTKDGSTQKYQKAYNGNL